MKRRIRIAGATFVIAAGLTAGVASQASAGGPVLSSDFKNIKFGDRTAGVVQAVHIVNTSANALGPGTFQFSGDSVFVNAASVSSDCVATSAADHRSGTTISLGPDQGCNFTVWFRDQILGRHAGKVEVTFGSETAVIRFSGRTV